MANAWDGAPAMSGLDAAIVGEGAPGGWAALPDPDGTVARMLCPAPGGTAWLIRPDGYLIARLDDPTPEQVAAARVRAGLVPPGPTVSPQTTS